jgi:hypothetical protein
VCMVPLYCRGINYSSLWTLFRLVKVRSLSVYAYTKAYDERKSQFYSTFGAREN